MGRLGWFAGLSLLVVPLLAGPVGKSIHVGARGGPGVPFNGGTHAPFVGNHLPFVGNHMPLGGTHVPFVGDHNWGSESEEFDHHHHRPYDGVYPGVFAYPVFPLSDWNSYLGDPGTYYGNQGGYYQNGPPVAPPDAYGPPNPYASEPNPYQPRAYEPAPEPYAAPAPAAPQVETPIEPLPPLVLILHDGQKLELANYAIVDGVLWDFSKRVAHKIPVSSIDMTASAKATVDNGGEFPQFSNP